MRDLKAKQEKSVWQPEVQILLQLKTQLADLQASGGKSQGSPAKGKAGSKEKPAEVGKTALPNGNTTVDASELEAAVTKQGLLVRELKSKEPKSVWQPQVEVLLKLKKQLSDLVGAPASADDKKSKKNKT